MIWEYNCIMDIRINTSTAVSGNITVTLLASEALVHVSVSQNNKSSVSRLLVHCGYSNSTERKNPIYIPGQILTAVHLTTYIYHFHNFSNTSVFLTVDEGRTHVDTALTKHAVFICCS